MISERGNATLEVLAVVGWILPLAGLVWGSGPWWMYLLWLAVGTVVIAAVPTDSKEDGNDR